MIGRHMDSETQNICLKTATLIEFGVRSLAALHRQGFQKCVKRVSYTTLCDVFCGVSIGYGNL
jgi:hypothetical protein